MTSSIYNKCLSVMAPHYLNEYAFTNDFLNRLPDDVWNSEETESNSRNIEESPKKAISAEALFEASRIKYGWDAMPVKRIHKPKQVDSRVTGFSPDMDLPCLKLAEFEPGTAYWPVVGHLAMPGYYPFTGPSAATAQTPSTVTVPTPPNSPSDENIDFDGLDLNSIISEFPQILEGDQEREPASYREILTELQKVHLIEESMSIPGTSLEESKPIRSECSDLFSSGPPDPLFNNALPSLMASPSDLHMDEPCNFGTFGDGCVKEEDIWSWGCVDDSVAMCSVKVRNASGNSDCVVAKPSPIRCLDEEYEHLPETPSSDVDIEDVEVLNDEKPGKVQKIDYVINASVKREHNYCEKKPSLNAFVDASSIGESDEDSEVKVVKIESAPQPIKKPFRIIYKTTTATTSMKGAQKPAKIFFKPFTKISVGLSHENIPTTHSPEVKQNLLMSIQESMTNKFSRKILKVSKIEQSGSAAPLSNAPKCEVDPLRLNSSSRVFSALPPSVQTRGKPEAYTKRIRDQHSETVKKAPKRKKTAVDKEDNIDKRLEHNTMERKRRVNIRVLFEELKSQVPSIQGDRKASKVCILTEARNYINGLKVYEENLRLHKRLSELQALSDRSVNLF